MLAIPVSIVSLPLALAVWATDSFLFLAGLRLALGHWPTARAHGAYKALEQITDPVLQAFERWIVMHTARTPKPWVRWVAVVLALMLARSLLVSILAAMAR